MNIFSQSRVRNYLRNMCKQMNKMTYDNDFSIWQTLLAIYPISIFLLFYKQNPNFVYVTMYDQFKILFFSLFYS